MNIDRRKSNAPWIVLLAVVLAAASLGFARIYDYADTAVETQSGETVDLSTISKGATVIVLADGASKISGSGAAVSGNTVTIMQPGAYTVSGELSSGQLVIDCGDEDEVDLILAGVSIKNESDAALYVLDCGKTNIYLAEGTANVLISGTEKAIDGSNIDSSASGGALTAKDDLEIQGSGRLEVYGYINNGVHCSNALSISGGELYVEAVNNGIKGKDSLSISGGHIEVYSGGDGLKSDDETGEGYGVISISGGNILISSCDDGIHAQTALVIDAGTVSVVRSYEGIEANQITINGGDISVVSQDDGINANGGSSFMMFGGRGQSSSSESSASSETPNLIINGGSIYVNAGGDGLDSNGNELINGGTVIVDGPVNSGNGALDSGSESGGRLLVNGGTVLAIGASGMDEVFGSDSAQNCFKMVLSSAAGAGTEITIADESGKVLFSHTSAKSFNSIVFSSSDLEIGNTYTVTAGSQSQTITLTSVSTSSGSGFGGGRTKGNRGGW